MPRPAVVLVLLSAPTRVIVLSSSKLLAIASASFSAAYGFLAFMRLSL